MRVVTIAASLCLIATACGEPASKSSTQNNTSTNNTSSNNEDPNNSSSNNASLNNTVTNNASSNNASTNNTSTNNANNELGGVGDVCDASAPCQAELRCQSAEERTWNFCGAPMEPECAENEVGDSCGNCFIACSADEDCDGTCNGTYCIGEQTCGEEIPPPP